MGKKHEPTFTGRWRIVSMDQWDVDYMEQEGPAIIEFGAEQTGEFRFGITSGTIDYRITERRGQPTAEWTWEGIDEIGALHGPGLGRSRGRRTTRHDLLSPRRRIGFCGEASTEAATM
jgi:hypothetical protein